MTDFDFCDSFESWCKIHVRPWLISLFRKVWASISLDVVMVRSKFTLLKWWWPKIEMVSPTISKSIVVPDWIKKENPLTHSLTINLISSKPCETQGRSILFPNKYKFSSHVPKARKAGHQSHRLDIPCFVHINKSFSFGVIMTYLTSVCKRIAAL